MDKLTTKTCEELIRTLEARHTRLPLGYKTTNDLCIIITCAFFNNSFKGNSPTGYASFAYDGMWAYALALDKLFKSHPFGLDTIKTNQTTQ